MAILTNGFADGAQRLIGACLEAIGQGILLYAMMALALAAFRRLSAATRYAIWLVGFLIVALLPIVNLAMGSRAGSGGAPIIESTTRPALPEIADFDPVQPAERIPIVEDQPGLPSTTGLVSIPASSFEGVSPALQVPAIPKGLLTFLLLAWASLAAILLLRILVGYVRIRRIRDRSELAPAAVQAKIGLWREALRIWRPVRVGFSDEVQVPVAVGFLRPRILIPARHRDRLSGPDLDRILLHEFAHLKRYDDWGRLAQQLVTAVSFFNPAVFWTGRKLDFEREIACDEMVIEQFPERKEYARCLTRLAELMGLNGNRSFAPGAWKTRSQLARRIHMLLDKTRTGSRYSPVTVWTGAAVVALVTLAALNLPPLVVFAQEAPVPTAGESAAKPDQTVASESSNSASAPVANARDLSTALYEDLSAAQAALADLLLRYTNKWPAVIQQREFIDRLRAAVAKELFKERMALAGLLARYKDNWPVVIEQRAKVAKLEELLAKQTAQAVDTRPAGKRDERLSAASDDAEGLVREEIGLVERHLQIIQNRQKVGRASEEEVLDVQRDLLKLKRELAAMQPPSVRSDLLALPLTGDVAGFNEKERKELFDYFVQLAKNEKEELRVRQIAMHSIARFGSPEAIRALDEIIENGTGNAKQVGIVALIGTKNQPGMEALLALYPRLTENESYHKIQLIKAFKSGIQTMPGMQRKLLDKLVSIARDEKEDARVRSEALQILGETLRP